MGSYHYLLDLVFILLGTKLFGILFKRLKMPQVVGALLAGIVIGPAVLGIVVESDYINVMSEIGVIVLMFLAGMEADIDELKKAGLASFVIALLGVIVPLIGGYILYAFYNPMFGGASDAHLQMLQNVFMGVVLTATSVSISVETLKEMGKLNSRAGNAILGAAIIDDILGIIVLAIVSGLAKGGAASGAATGGVMLVLLKIVGFFAFSVVVGFLFRIFFKNWTDHIEKNQRRYVIVCFAFCLFMAYISEAVFDVADITGAFIAGLMLTGLSKRMYIVARCETMSYGLLSPIFFASIGLKIVRPDMNLSLITFTVLLLVVAVITKVIGCFIGARLCRYSRRESAQISSGMISRGEVALIVANKGLSSGLLPESVMAPVVIVVVLTTIIAPLLLKLTFSLKRRPKGKKVLKAAPQEM